MARKKPNRPTSASKTYAWSGVQVSTGKRVKSQMVAPSEAAVVTALKREGFQPTSVKPVASGGMNMNIGPEGVKFKWAQKAEFSRRLYQMLRAGISTSRALESMAKGAKPEVAKMCMEMSEKVSSGVPLSVAMSEHPRAFDEVFCSYVRSGEESGTTTETLGRLSTMMAKRAAMAAKIKGVMAYPKMVGGSILVITMGIIMFLVPSYVKIYDSFGAKLPGPTLALVWLSNHMMPISIKSVHIGALPFFAPIPQPFHVISVVLYFVAGWWYFRKRTKGNLEVGRKLDLVKFKMPVLGQLNHKSSLFQWSSTLAGGLESGVPMTRALELAAASSGSDWQKLTAIQFQEAVRSGRTISKAMEDHPDLYPPNVRDMLATGEAVGEAAEMLESVAMSLDEDVDGLVEGLSAKIEVALLLVLGVVVGGLLMVLYLPILQLATTATKGLGVGG